MSSHWQQCMYLARCLAPYCQSCLYHLFYALPQCAYKIEDGAWVGAKTTVCPGVTVHRNAILTVGSVATKDLELNGIYQGNPAVKIRERKIKS